MGKVSGELVTEEGKWLTALQSVCLLDASHYVQYANKIIGSYLTLWKLAPNVNCSTVTYNNLRHQICCDIILKLVLLQ